MSVKELTGAFRSADKNGNKQVLYPMTKIDLVEGLRDELNSLEVSKTATGSSLAVDDSANLPLLGLSLYGKSTQKRTTGAQLVNLPNIEAYDAKGITWSCENGVVTAKGTSTAISSSSDKIVADIPVIAGAYYVSGGVGEVKVFVRIVQADGSYVWYTDQAFTLDGTEDQVTLYCQIVAGMTVDATLYPMLNKGSAPLPYEPYTGGIPSPNPDFPQEIANIGDAGSVDVGVYGGNLLDYSAWRKVGVGGGAGTFDWKDDGVVITATANDTYTMYSATYGYTYPVSCTPNTTYTMSWDWSGNADDRVFVFFNGLSEKNVNVLSDKGELTFTTLDDTTFFTFRVGCSTAGTTSTYKNVQFNLGDTALLYEPYKSKQVLTISTPNGLPGIQVTEASLANYTDPYGNMWCCDEVDLGRGVYVKRIERCSLTAENFLDEFGSSERGVTIQGEIPTKHVGNNYADVIICDSFPTSSWSGGNWNRYDNTICLGGNDANRVQVSLSSNIATSLTAFKEMLGEKMVTVQYVMATPIETPLSESELAQYAALHTNCPNTTVLNDKNAEMGLTYYTKRYNEAIDFIINKIENNRDEIRAIKDIVEVTLLASNWSGSTAPYTQTVEVAGITEDHNPTLVTVMYEGISLEAKEAYRYAFSRIAAGTGETNNGSVTFSVSEKPTIDITVGLKGV